MTTIDRLKELRDSIEAGLNKAKSIEGGHARGMCDGLQISLNLIDLSIRQVEVSEAILAKKDY